MPDPQRLHSILNGQQMTLHDMKRLVRGVIVPDSAEREEHTSTISFVSPVDPTTLAKGATVVEVDEDGGMGYDAILAVAVTRMLRDRLLQQMAPLFAPDAFTGTVFEYVNPRIKELVDELRAEELRQRPFMGDVGGHA